MNANEFHERERFEHDLINRRLTWLFTSQSVLFAAYGVATRAQKSDNPHAFLKMTAISGSVISSLILLGVIAAFIAKRTVWKEYQKTVPSAQFGVKTWITDGLGKHSFGSIIERGPEVFRVSTIHEANSDPKPGESIVKEIIRSTIKAGRGDDFVTSLGDI